MIRNSFFHDENLSARLSSAFWVEILVETIFVGVVFISSGISFSKNAIELQLNNNYNCKFHH